MRQIALGLVIVAVIFSMYTVGAYCIAQNSSMQQETTAIRENDIEEKTSVDNLATFAGFVVVFGVIYVVSYLAEHRWKQVREIQKDSAEEEALNAEYDDSASADDVSNQEIKSSARFRKR